MIEQIALATESDQATYEVEDLSVQEGSPVQQDMVLTEDGTHLYLMSADTVSTSHLYTTL